MKTNRWSVTLMLVTVLNSPLLAYAGSDSTRGGGDSCSQQFWSRAQNLPEMIELKGVQYFPEVNMTKLRRFLADPRLSVEENTDIKVAGHPKDAQNYPDKMLIDINPNAWEKMGEMKQTALALHEVLGLMRVEHNDDYHISSRLLSKTYADPAPRGNHREGIVLSQNPTSPEAIIVKVNSDGSRTFQYCTNRDQPNSCGLLGTRSYQVKELSQLRVALIEDAAKNEKEAKTSNRHFGQIWAGIEIVSTAAGYYLVKRFAPYGSAIGGAAFGAGAGLLFSILPGSSIDAVVESARAEVKKDLHQADLINGSLINGDNQRPGNESLSDYAQEVDALLRTLN